MATLRRRSLGESRTCFNSGSNRDRTDDMSDGARGDLEFGIIPGMLAVAAARHSERTAVEDGATVLTYGALRADVRRAARSLMALGIVRGDRVAIWAPNRWEWMVAALATHAAGG